MIKCLYRISVCIDREDGDGYGDPSLLFEDDMVLLVSPDQGLQRALEQFVAESEARWIRVGSWKVETIDLAWK